MDEIREIEKKIATLPAGYISKKQYLPKVSLEMNAIYGNDLRNYCTFVENYKERDCCNEIRTYLYGQITPRICVVYGLRRTGKTTMILQIISKMTAENFAKTIYMKARKGQSMSMLDRDIKKLYDAGYRYVFIDEVTFIEDFIDTASFLSDIYAAIGMKIVLSGTDSLGLWFASHEELYDRTYTVHTTWIPYAEHARLLGIKDIDEYIRYGGTLRVGENDFDDPELKNEEVSFRDDESTRRYIDTAICQNIQHSLKCYENGEHLRNLRELYINGELTGAINRVIESINHRFFLDVLTKNFKSSNLALAKKNLMREKDSKKRTDILDRIDLQAVTERLMEILSIRNKEMMKTNITENHVEEIREYLTALELIETCYVRFSKGGYEKQTIVTQPGMRYVQTQALVYSLIKDESFDNMNMAVKNYVCEKILDEVKGGMMEEIVLLETTRKSKNADVFKLIFAVGEFDMVIYRNDTNTCEIYEIKHGTEIIPEQAKHLCDNEKCKFTEDIFGKITKKAVIYRGKSTIAPNNIQYLNVSEYLTPSPDL